jgi:hypothetical protein
MYSNVTVNNDDAAKNLNSGCEGEEEKEFRTLFCENDAVFVTDKNNDLFDAVAKFIFTTSGTHSPSLN